MGVVYRAMDVLLEREVAIKRLRSEYAASASVLERFRKEAQLQAKLNHPNIAQLYTLLQDGDSLCIVMEFIDGTVLRNFMPMPWLAPCRWRCRFWRRSITPTAAACCTATSSPKTS